MIKKLQSKSFQHRLLVVLILFLLFLMSYGITTTVQSLRGENNYTMAQFASVGSHHALGLVVGKNHHASPNKKNWNIAKKETKQNMLSNASQIKTHSNNVKRQTNKSSKRMMMIARYINVNDVNRHRLQSASVNKKTGQIAIHFKNSKPTVTQKRYANYLLRKLNA